MEAKLPPFVKKIVNTLEKDGREIYIVGGVVRDLVIGRPSLDWDFTTDAAPEIIMALFPDSYYDNKFGTVGVVNPEEKKSLEEAKDHKHAPLTDYYHYQLPVYEITTFRKEGHYSDKRHPDEVVWGKTLEEDLVRRDFTMNAMALKAAKGQDLSNVTWQFEIIDPHGGREDIKRKLIRAVGDPNKRFQEDALRMLRAVRLATQLRFTIEQKTFEAIKRNLSLIDFVSGERIRDELLKLLSYPNADEGYLLLHDLGLAEKILPEVERGFGVEQKSPGRHHLWDVGTHSVLSLKNTHSDNPIVKLAALIHDIGKPLVADKTPEGTITFYNHETVGATLAKSIGYRLKLSKKDITKLVTLVRWHQFTVDERQTEKAIKRFARNVGKDNLDDMLVLRTADRIGGGAKESSWRLEKFKQKLIEAQKQPFTVADLKIDGHDVMKELNLRPGRRVGEILNELFEKVCEDEVSNDREVLLKKIQNYKS